MGKKKLLRCTKPGCRTLTSHQLCDQHRTEIVVTNKIESLDKQYLLAMIGEQRSAMWEKNKNKLKELRVNLNDLWFVAQRTDRNKERPTFLN